MKRLILLRHAKSNWDDAAQPDVERPLSARGERDAPLMGARLAARGERPALIVTSHANRALRTARLVATALDVPSERLQIDEALYLASPPAILDVIGDIADEHVSLLAVGHNPGLTELVNRLLPDVKLHNLPTAGVIAADFAVGRWTEITSAVGRLAFYDFPKNRDRPTERPR